MRINSSKTINDVMLEHNNDYSEFENAYYQKTGIALLSPNRIPQGTTYKKPFTVSIIIPAYNTQSSILACLTSIEQSSFNSKYQDRLQVIVVDDGSTDNTWNIIKTVGLSLHLTVIHQTNHGQAQALNTGVGVAEGEIIIFCDSDMVLGYYSIEQFVTSHQQIPNALFAGFRFNTPENDPRINPTLIKQNGIHTESFFKNDERIAFPNLGWPSNMCLASTHFKKLGHGKSLWMPDNDVWLLPDLVFGALFSISRSTFLDVGGFDERLIGWGCTDGYLAAKIISVGNYIIPLYSASGLHINHPVRLKNKQLQYKHNRKLFFELIQTTKIINHPNWVAYTKKRIVSSLNHNPKKVLCNETDKKNFRNNNELSLNNIDNLLAVGEYSQALNSTLSQITDKYDRELYMRLGKAYLGMNMYKKAINIFKNISTSNAASIDTALDLVLAQSGDAQFSEAKKNLKILSQIYFRNADFSYWLNTDVYRHIRTGENYFNQGFYQVARHCFEAALIIQPDNDKAHKLRNKCLRIL